MVFSHETQTTEYAVVSYFMLLFLLYVFKKIIIVVPYILF